MPRTSFLLHIIQPVKISIMADTKPRVSRVKVKVSNVDPLDFEAKVSNKDVIGSTTTTVWITVESGSEIKPNDEFVLYMYDPNKNNEIVRFPEAPHNRLVDGKSLEGAALTYEFKPSCNFEYKDNCTFERLNFSSVPGIDKHWDTIGQDDPNVSFSIDIEKPSF